MTLHDYINSDRNLHPSFNPDQLLSPVFIQKDSSDVQKYQNLWTIGIHIACGLEFMHAYKHVHRDLKPTNGTIKIWAGC